MSKKICTGDLPRIHALLRQAVGKTITPTYGAWAV